MEYPVVDITETSIAHAREFIGDLKAFRIWKEDWLEEQWVASVRAGIRALHAIVAPDADPRATAIQMGYPIPAARFDRATRELAEVLMGQLEALEYRYMGGQEPEYLSDNEWNWRKIALALAYALPDWENLPATVFAPVLLWEETPEGIAAQEEKDVETALLSWPEYVRHQVSPKLRGDYAPTVARLAERLHMTPEAVQAVLNRLGREVAA